MPMNNATVIAKVSRLLEQHAATALVVRKHAERLADARARLDAIDGELEIFAQHRAVSDEAREKVSAALAESTGLPGAKTDEDIEVPDDASALA